MVVGMTGNKNPNLHALQTRVPAAPAAIKMTALGLPALLERASTSLLSIRDLFSRFDTGGWASG